MMWNWRIVNVFVYECEKIEEEEEEEEAWDVILVTKKEKRYSVCSFTLSAAKDEPFCSFWIKVTFGGLSPFLFYNISSKKKLDTRRTRATNQTIFRW